MKSKLTLWFLQLTLLLLLPFKVHAIAFEAMQNEKTAIIRWPSQYGSPQIRQQATGLVLTFHNQALQMPRRNVFGDGGLLHSVFSRQIGNDSQIVAELSGQWQYTTEQQENWHLIYIEKSSSQSVLSLHFQQIEVRRLLQIIAAEANINLVISDSVQGKMSISVRDMEWEQVLAMILDAQNLERRRYGSAWQISAKNNATTDSSDLSTQTFRLRYLSAQAMQTMFQSATGNDKNAAALLSSRGSILFDKNNNSLIVRDTPQVLHNLRALLDELDVPVRQVMVEARIVEAGEGVAQEIGVKFGLARQGNTAWGANWNSAASNNVLQDFTPNVNLPAAAAAGSIALVRPISSSALGLELSAMEQDNRTKTISRPRVLTQDQKLAEIKQGFQIPYQTRYKDGEYSISFKDAVLSLKVLPRITPDNRILLDIAVNKDAIDRSLSNLDGEPAIATQQLNTQAIVENGGTLVIGGIYQDSFAHTVHKVPLLGDLPWVGNLFKSRSRNHNRNELLFLITPLIVDEATSHNPQPTQP